MSIFITYAKDNILMMKLSIFLKVFLILLLLMGDKIQSKADKYEKFTNPMLKGDYPDPSVMRDGEDYYLVNSSFDYVPGLLVQHSRDLVHWEPIGAALNKYIGSVWAPDICKYNGRYYIYFTVNTRPESNYVVWTDNIHGSWSEPVKLGVGMIDPCHVVDEQGRRWLFVSGGNRIRLSDDGLSTIGSMEKVYEGWLYPADWITEGYCLEGPKIRRIGRYFYYLSAEGGTAGAPTSHMVTVARAECIDGPWENMPTNPLIHTYSAEDIWWSRGHGSLIDTPDGRWYIVYHAYERGFYNLGRQTLLAPVNINNDGWLAASQVDTFALPLSNVITALQKTTVYSKERTLPLFRIGYEWKGYKAFDISRINVNNGILTLKAAGNNVAASNPLLFVAGEHSYEFSVKVTLEGDATAGLILLYNADYYVGMGFDGSNRYRWRMGNIKNRMKDSRRTLWLRLRNDHHVVTGYYSEDGQHWMKENWGMEVSGYNHNTLYDFQSLLPGFFVYGNGGKATFTDFKYTPLQNTILDKKVRSGIFRLLTEDRRDSCAYIYQ